MASMKSAEVEKNIQKTIVDLEKAQARVGKTDGSLENARVQLGKAKTAKEKAKIKDEISGWMKILTNYTEIMTMLLRKEKP